MIRGDFLYHPNKSKIGSLLPRYIHIYYQVFRYEYYLSQLVTEIGAGQGDLDQAEHLAELENQLRELDMATGQIRIYLLGFPRTLVTAQAIMNGNIEISHQIAEDEKPLLVVLSITKRNLQAVKDIAFYKIVDLKRDDN